MHALRVVDDGDSTVVCVLSNTNMMERMPHQQRFYDWNPRKAIANHEMRTGKSLIGAEWIARRTGVRVIVCPKQVKKDWEKFDTGAMVLSKEEFKKVAHTLTPSALVFDEAHFAASALFLRRGKGRSQLAEALYKLVQRCPDMDVLLLTATPVRNDAWSLHTLLCYIGVYYDWKVWREEFFELKPMPWLPRQPWMRAGHVPEAWAPRRDWRERLRPYLLKHTDIVTLRDVVEYLPPATTRVVEVKHKEKYKKPEDEVVNWMHEHQWEQRGKGKEILELGYKKVIVVCHYTAQIDALAEELAVDGRPVFVLDGRTKDADMVKRSAQDAEECYFICQSSMLFGFDGWMFGALIFASMSHSCVNHVQSLGRVRHIQHLVKPQIIYLIGGRWDKRILDTVSAGIDFNPNNFTSQDI